MFTTDGQLYDTRNRMTIKQTLAFDTVPLRILRFYKAIKITVGPKFWRTLNSGNAYPFSSGYSVSPPNWWSTVLLENLLVAQLFKKYFISYSRWNFIDQAFHPTSLRSVLIIYSLMGLGLQRVTFFSSVPSKFRKKIWSTPCVLCSRSILSSLAWQKKCIVKIIER